MTNLSYTRLAGWCAILAAPIALTSFFLGPIAYQWDFDAMFDPQRAIAHPNVNATLVRWGWVLDIMGYYWLLLPASVLLTDLASRSRPLHAQLAARAGYGYMITGSIGAAVLAGTTDLFGAYAQGDAATRAAVSTTFGALFGLVYVGLWNTLCMSLLAVWLWMSGSALRGSHRGLGFFAMALGVCAALDVLGLLSGLEGVSMFGLFAYLFLFPVWSAWLGTWLLRGRNNSPSNIN
ncbi:MAG TPA: hypothetical protein PLB89_08635 [Flavobacteriales bacterium]|nr:hypothetical protein [Flavobacteriales bacterium]